MPDSIRLRNDDPESFFGLSFPLTNGASGYFNTTATLLDQAVHNLRNLLLTVKGERVGQANYGSELARILFEPITDDIGILIEEAILTAISTNNLDHIDIKSVITEVNEQNNNRVIVKITFSVSLDPNNEQTLALEFQTVA